MRERWYDLKIVSVRAARSRGYITVTVASSEEEKKSLTVSEEDYSTAGSPMARDEIGNREYLILLSSDEYYRARLSALRILSYGDNNEKSLIRKLTAKGISRDRAEAVAHEMTSLGYINERKQLSNIITKEANITLTGPRKIRAKLLAKGYKSADISVTIDELVYSGEIDFERSAELLVSKKLTRGATDDEKKALLYKMGYNIC